MKKFNYKFESIQKIKKTQEKQAQKEVATIDLEIEKWKEKRGRLLIEAKTARDEFPFENITVSDIAFHKNHQLVMKRMIEDTNQQISSLQLSREKKMTELLERSRESKMYEILKEKHLDIFVKEQDKIELSQIDEFATQKYVRGER
ncbi:MAG: flagellar FliJ family protein [Bacteroidetes bacterium]|nr:flagellar FliJ family protein [Bacteroidota bacterium]